MKNLASRITRLLATMTFATALTFANDARADDSAAEHAKKARIAYDLQDWNVAVLEFRSAYAAEQKPEYLFGLGQSQRQNGDYQAAIASFKAYKRIDSVSSQQATTAELLITKCEAEFAKEEAEAAARRNAAQTQAPAPAPAQPAVNPSWQAPLSPTPRGEDRSSGPRHFYEDVLGDSLFVVGLGAAGAGTFFLLQGNSQMTDAKSKPTDAAAGTAADSAHGKQVVGAVMMPIGAVLIAGAVYRWVTVGKGDGGKTSGLLVGPSYVGYAGQF